MILFIKGGRTLSLERNQAIRDFFTLLAIVQPLTLQANQIVSILDEY